jgi:hypothetical protein
VSQKTLPREYLTKWAFFLRLVSGDVYLEGRCRYGNFRILGIPVWSSRRFVR